MGKFDLCIIGGGPTGYAAAMRAIDLGKKVILVENDKVGGAGVYNGALSSKTLWELSQKVYEVNKTVVSTGRQKFEISWEEVKRTMNEAIFDRKFQYSCHLKLLQTETEEIVFRYERGFGKMLNPSQVEVTKHSGEKKIIDTENIIIATGSHARKLPNVAIDEKTIMTSDGIHQIEDFPKSLVIVGAGVIGCEFATIFSNFGKTKVYLLDRAERILPFEDEDVAKLVADNLQEKGVEIFHSVTLVSMNHKEEGVEFEVSLPDGTREIMQAERALISIG
ncbi:MAG: FAD-dependent oxidoreductase, partial [Crocinitomicaceae bacterium]|nr:FAD-dependent oxidoreductase [Crocinitomicaceae bacterium]